MKFRPCIDLHEGVVKQIVGSSLTEEDGDKPAENFVSSKDAAYYARWVAAYPLQAFAWSIMNSHPF